MKMKQNKKENVQRKEERYLNDVRNEWLKIERKVCRNAIQ